ncbi:tyrosine-type recombinase/integrase [Pantoea cypripedii]|uniref:Integrase n=1 Tax=Pantoea cypripedii TaxID=55209 RepID=A0A6B9FXA3_PANCY|nr:tyrosine-type recombinase/integrase [Pantoea cypripedii]QGY28328.1 integrase [Pantoea cypripedii]
MKLNVRQIEAAKPKEKAWKLADGGGLYLEIFPSGGKSWRLKYRYAGKEKRVVFGLYPAVSLAQARGKREDAKRILAAGGDPGARKQEEKQAKILAACNNFEALAREWHEYKRVGWSKGYANDILEYLRKDIFPHVGKMPVTEIKPTRMLEVLQKMERRGVLDKLKKTRQACKQIYAYAIITGRAEYNPVSDLAGALKSPKQKHFPYLLHNELGEFLRALCGYGGSMVTQYATRLLMLTGTRTIELRAAEWVEFDLHKGIWQIPEERMKMRRKHVVPLSRQAIELLEEIHPLTGRGKYVFAGRNDAGKPMSEATINQVIKRVGYDGRATGHGFRHTMSTILHEQGYNSAWIETQLAHADKNTIRGTYNHAKYLDGRRVMLQWYADYLDGLRDGV